LKNFMSDTVVGTLILDPLEWVANGERSYEEVMDAWRTSCPKASDLGMRTIGDWS
jgi:hypothetical protein